MANDSGIVGSILVQKNAAMIWLGWGHVDSTKSNSTAVGEGRGIPSMGSVVIGFPRRQWRTGVLTTFGGDRSEEDQILGWRMAGRLRSLQLGYPFLCRARFAADPPPE